MSIELQTAWSDAAREAAAEARKTKWRALVDQGSPMKLADRDWRIKNVADNTTSEGFGHKISKLTDGTELGPVTHVRFENPETGEEMVGGGATINGIRHPNPAENGNKVYQQENDPVIGYHTWLFKDASQGREFRDRLVGGDVSRDEMKQVLSNTDKEFPKQSEEGDAYGRTWRSIKTTPDKMGAERTGLQRGDKVQVLPRPGQGGRGKSARVAEVNEDGSVGLGSGWGQPSQYVHHSWLKKVSPAEAKRQELEASNTMSKKNMILACDAAMSATDAANKDNTHEAHSDAASKHRIAAEHCKLMGEDAMHEKHKSMAVDHDLCAGRCKAADGTTNKVNAPAPSAEEVKARTGCPEQAEDEDMNIKCEKCGKEFDASKEPNAETGQVNCPGCDHEVKVASSHTPKRAQARRASKGGALEATWSDEARAAAAAARKGGAFGKGSKFTFNKRSDLGLSEGDWGGKEVHEMAENHHGDEGEVTSTDIDPQVEGDHKSGYYSIKFKNGDEMLGVSGEHLSPHESKRGGSLGAHNKRETYLATANKLSAKRMVSRQPLMAALSGAGWSLNDMQQRLGPLIGALDVCQRDDDNSCGPCCGWAADVVVPEHEDGEEWTAVFTGADGVLYGVPFTVGEDVELTGDPAPIEKTSDYEYVADIEAKAQAAQGALEATWSDAAREAAALARKHGATNFDKKHAEALKYKSIADSSEERTNKSGSTKDIHDAMSAHTSAIMVHHEAANAAKAEGNMPAYHAHMDMASEHQKQRDAQYKKLAVPVAHEARATNNKQPLCAKVRSCHDALVASGSNPTLKAVASAVWKEHKLSLGEDDVARELAASKQTSTATA